LHPRSAAGCECVAHRRAWAQCGHRHPGILLDLYGTLHRGRCGKDLQAVPLFFRVELYLLVSGAGAFAVGLDPYLEEVHRLCIGTVELAMDHAIACRHLLDLVRAEHLNMSHAVLVSQFALENVTENLHVTMGMGTEAASGGDAIVIDHT